VRRSRPSHPAPNVRDDREAPLFRERDGADSAGDLRGPQLRQINATGKSVEAGNGDVNHELMGTLSNDGPDVMPALGAGIHVLLS